MPGIKNPAVDKLIDSVIFAKDRDELVAATQGARPRAAVESVRDPAVLHATSTGSPAGTASGTPKTFRRIRLGFPTSGGTTTEKAREGCRAMSEINTAHGAEACRGGGRGPDPPLSRLRPGELPRARHGGHRRPEIRAGFRALRLRQRRCAARREDRHAAAAVDHNQNPATFNTLNMFVLNGDGAAGMGLTSASLMDSLHRRARQPLRPRGEGSGDFRRPKGIAILPSPGSEFPRRVAAHRGGRSVLARNIARQGASEHRDGPAGN